MDITYTRVAKRPDGILSKVTRDDTDAQIMVVLEHAFKQPDGSYDAILQPGTYICVRSMHRLHGMTQDFETFEIQNVVDAQGNAHSGVLFHWGNWNEDSEGCSLTGRSFAVAPDPNMNGALEDLVTSSRETFAMFMQLQANVDKFQLTVEQD